MNSKTVVGLIGSVFITFVGLYRLFSESLSSTPLFIAYLFIITGLVGVCANGIKLFKSKKI
ncbi:thiamine-phosphate diphosphorylase [Oceanobacillus picturae]|uniref:Thiamine-phosphate diphosphorylase n=1 Tax=Oceanobacillus picturae TaxID=171693 RepID=A0A0U9HA26_9BACI|nr:hypothetical protein [Oceanobacillus picturae]GAQ19275.1 thiamine-phosphate diphosphorylase [Oceanobacillus picturae]